MHPKNSPEVVVCIQELATSFRTKLQRLQGKFNDPVLLARLTRQTDRFAKKCLTWCEQVDTEEAYGTLREFANLVSDFSLSCQNMNIAAYDKLHILALKLHNATCYNRRRISPGHPKKVPVT